MPRAEERGPLLQSMRMPRASDDSQLLAECRARSIELLRRNSTAAGVLAAAPTPRAAARGYTAIFGRDALLSFLRDFHSSTKRRCSITLVQSESSGDLGYVISEHTACRPLPGGTIDDGHLLETWRQDVAGAWRCVADMYVSDHARATEASSGHRGSGISWAVKN